VAIVLVATVLSVLGMRYVYRLERHHVPSTKVLVAMAIWFLLTYGFMAFVIQPS
jgi:hypothetical protein